MPERSYFEPVFDGTSRSFGVLNCNIRSRPVWRGAVGWMLSPRAANYAYFNKALPRSAPQLVIITPITQRQP